METLKLKDGRHVAVDGARATVFDLKIVEANIEKLEMALAELPSEPDEKELLTWARANHPTVMDYSKHRAALEKDIAMLRQLKESANGR